MKPWILILCVIILVILALLANWYYPLLSFRRESQEFVQVETSLPTNFIKAGTLTFQGTTPYFEGKKLVFDGLSFCAPDEGSVPCVAMSTTYDLSFGEKTIILEGEQSGDQILVRKLRALRDGEPLLLGSAGNIFVTWPDAQKIIEKCHASMVMQTHALDIIITLKNGKEIRSIEPGIDQIWDITQKAQSSCGNITIATE